MNAIIVESSSMPANTLTSPLVAEMLALGPTPASVLLLMVITRIEAPSAPRPPAAAPAMPNTSRLSFAQTCTWPPATTVPSIVAVVPAVGTVEIAVVATLPPTARQRRC